MAYLSHFISQAQTKEKQPHQLDCALYRTGVKRTAKKRLNVQNSVETRQNENEGSGKLVGGWEGEERRGEESRGRETQDSDNFDL